MSLHIKYYIIYDKLFYINYKINYNFINALEDL